MKNDMTTTKGPKETTMKDTTEQIITFRAIYMVADAAATEADTQLDRIYYHGTSMDKVMKSLSKIKSLLDVIKEQTSGLYDDRENGGKDEQSDKN